MIYLYAFPYLDLHSALCFDVLVSIIAVVVVAVGSCCCDSWGMSRRKAALANTRDLSGTQERMPKSTLSLPKCFCLSL